MQITIKINKDEKAVFIISPGCDGAVDFMR